MSDMELKTIKTDDLILPADIFMKRWFALTAGDEKDFNTMTIAWGSIGTMWHLPFIQVVVRHSRHTFTFMEKYNSFSICSFPKENKPDLNILGTKSGRDCNKISETKLTVMKSEIIDTPCFQEADLIIECKKMYSQDMDPEQFLSDKIMKHYPDKDFHRIYFGEIIHVRGSEKFSKSK